MNISDIDSGKIPDVPAVPVDQIVPIERVSVSAPTDSLGVIIPSVKGRKVAYAVYAGVSLVITNVAVAFSAIGANNPAKNTYRSSRTRKHRATRTLKLLNIRHNLLTDSRRITNTRSHVDVVVIRRAPSHATKPVKRNNRLSLTSLSHIHNRTTRRRHHNATLSKTRN